MKIFLILFCGVCYFPFLSSQVEHTQLQDSIETIQIKATRIVTPINKVPRSLTLINIKELGGLTKNLSFNEYVEEVPGLFVLNSNNFAQDLRVSIRGFGARSAFGIRGIKLIVDGIPETTPDGQGQIDNIDLGVIQNIEILRGGASSIYGNASGGVININTISEISESYVSFGTTIGDYGLNIYNISAGVAIGSSQFIVHSGHTNVDGFRQHSSMSSTNFNLRYLNDLEIGKLDFIINYTNTPTAEDPGGVTIESINEDSKLARDRNVSFNAGESIEQVKLSGRFIKSFSENNELESYLFYSKRDFFGLLPFQFGGAVDLNRDYGGHGTQLKFVSSLEGGTNHLSIGYDVAIQKDNRRRYSNDFGEIGELALDQKESFSNIGIYVQNQRTHKKWTIEGGLRYDFNLLKANDNYLVDGDGSDKITYSKLNYSLGVLYKLFDKGSVFVNYGSSFETPTLSELSADPNGAGGFNSVIKPQIANTFELGLRGTLSKLNSYELIWFSIRTQDELIPYELEAFPGRDFYRNAGRTLRKGIELSFNQVVFNSLKLRTSYSYSDFEYDSYVLNGSDLKGNKLPGIPNHRFTLSTIYKNESGWTVRVQSLSTGDILLNDSNSVSTNPYTLVNASFAYPFLLKSASIEAFFGINNLFDQDYFDNIRINAFGSRYYEAGPKRHIYGGLKITL